MGSLLTVFSRPRMGKKKGKKKKGGKKKEVKEEVKVEEVEEIDEEPFIILELKASDPERALALQRSQRRRARAPCPLLPPATPATPATVLHESSLPPDVGIMSP